MMVSDHFRAMEDKIASQLLFHEELVQEIARKLKKEESAINKALYTAGIASGAQSCEAGIIVNEFLAALNEKVEASQ